MEERKNSAARIRTNNKWTNAHYDRINIAVPKGQKDTVQAHAAARGESVNGFIGRAIGETMERDSGAGTPAGDTQTQGGAGVVSLDPETLEIAQRAAEGAGEPVPVLIGQAVRLRAGLEPGNVAQAVENAERTGETVSQFINRAISEALTAAARVTAEPPTGPGVVSLPPDVLERAQRAAESIGETVPGLVVRSVRAIAGQIERKQASGQAEQGPVTLNYETEEAVRAAAERTGETVEAFLSRAVDVQAARDDRTLATGGNPVQRYQAEKELAELRRKRQEQ